MTSPVLPHDHAARSSFYPHVLQHSPFFAECLSDFVRHFRSILGVLGEMGSLNLEIADHERGEQ